MFEFNFSNITTLTRNTSSYPITLAEVKARSEYFRINPTDTSLDSYINLQIIPKVVYDWEKSTKYLLLDQTLQAFVPNIRDVNIKELNIGICNLNVRQVSNIKYYPKKWNYSDTKLTLETDKYFLLPESGRFPIQFNIREEYLPFTIFSMTNNLEANYSAGFQNNNFSTINPLIVDALATQAAMAIDARTGFCPEFYSDIVGEVYANYTMQQQEVVII